MSQGSPMFTFRLSDEMGVSVMNTIRHRNANTSDTPWTFSDFVRKAIQEKLDHMERSRRPRNRIKKEEPYEG